MAICRHGLMAVMVMGAALLLACGDSGEKPVPRVEVNDMRGIVVRTPTAEKPRVVAIWHEATRQMGAMTMEFTVAEGISLTKLKVGDIVAFRQEVNLTARTDLVTKLEKLPADTVLDFGAGGMTMPMK